MSTSDKRARDDTEECESTKHIKLDEMPKMFTIHAIPQLPEPWPEGLPMFEYGNIVKDIQASLNRMEDQELILKEERRRVEDTKVYIKCMIGSLILSLLSLQVLI